MKIKNYIVIPIGICALLVTVHSAFAQGALAPLGAPAPTMKSLDQIEARTAITNTTTLVTITQPGSYYLTHNLTVSTGDGIDIVTNGVTLDLNGFTISSTAASAAGNGILIGSGLSDITICNGHIRGGVTNNGSNVYGGGGFAFGIAYSGNAPVNVLVSRISVSGCLNYGIYLNTGNSTVVEACTVKTVGSYGIVASGIKSCSALDCGSFAIYGDEVADSHGQSSGSGYGLFANIALNCYGNSSGSGGYGLYATTAQNCYGVSSGSGGEGLYANSAQNCYGVSSGSGGEGLYANSAQNCYGYSSSGYAIYATTALNCYGYSDGSGYGIVADEINNCEGYSSSGYGIYGNDIAIGSLGYTSTGTGIDAFIGNSCYGYIYSSGTAENITHKYNMP